MPLLTTLAKVTDKGKLEWCEPIRLAAYLVPAKGQTLTVTLDRESKRRTNAQNARLWGALYPFVGEMLEQRTHFPWSKEMVHDLCTRAFLGTVEVEVGGEIHQVRKRSSTLSKADFALLMERVELWISEEWKIDPALIENPEMIP